MARSLWQVCCNDFVLHLKTISMRLLSREHFKPGIVFNAQIFHCGLIFIGIVVLQAKPNGGFLQNKASQSNTTVPDPYEPVGCFRDKGKSRALPTQIKMDQFINVNWTDMANSFAAIIYHCAAKVYKKGFWYFGVEYHKECWSGVNGSLSYNRHGPSIQCFMNYSVGAQWTIFVYRFVQVNGSWNQWSSWQPCSLTCGGGNRTRNRTCSNPAPRWNGKDCPGTNISSETCNLNKCKEDNFRHNNKTYNSQSTGESALPLVAKTAGSSLLALLCVSVLLWFVLRYRRSRIVGEGAFGKVYRGELLKQLMEVGKGGKSLQRKTNKEQKRTKKGLTVAVKMLQNGATEEQMQEFLEEIQLMKQIGYHRNILNLLACCTMTKPMFLVVEFAKNGDLLNYLRKRREQIKQAFEGTGEAAPQHSRYRNIEVINEGSLYDCTSGKSKGARLAHWSIRDDNESERDLKTTRDNLHDDDTVRPDNLMTFAWQIAKGMEFLSGKGFVHRDLAARNVLVCEGKLLKIADFGLSRNVYVEKVYHSTKNRKLPIKWMSPEAIHDQVFTAESDVWAFGIVLWEILTIGGTPYPTVSNHQLLGALKSGYRMDKPQICSDDMFGLMRQCWKENPAERPSFTVIRGQLERMMLNHCPYLDMADVDYSSAPCYDADSNKETELENTAL